MALSLLYRLILVCALVSRTCERQSLCAVNGRRYVKGDEIRSLCWVFVRWRPNENGIQWGLFSRVIVKSQSKKIASHFEVPKLVPSLFHTARVWAKYPSIASGKQAPSLRYHKWAIRYRWWWMMKPNVNMKATVWMTETNGINASIHRNTARPPRIVKRNNICSIEPVAS